MKTNYFIQFFFILTTFLVTGIATVNAQVMKITSTGNTDAVLTTTTAQSRFYSIGNHDGFHFRTADNAAALPNGADIVWLYFPQVQPSDAGLLSMTSMSAGLGWSTCFKVRADGNVGIFNSYPSVALEVGSSSSIRQVKVNGNIVFGSDERMKDNIRDIPNSLNTLRKLRSVTYNFKEENIEQPIPEKFLKDGVDIEKMKAEFKSVPKTNQYLLERNFYGFVAQDVQKIFPELVYADSAGMLSVDYIGIIPIVVESIKEQQQLIENQSKTIEELKKLIDVLGGESVIKANSATNTSLNNISTANSIQAALYQNAPNPFSQDTRIGFHIPETVNTASLNIYDMQGKQLMQYAIAQRGESSQVISGNHFSAGMYLYALIVDGTVVDTKRMILTK